MSGYAQMPSRAGGQISPPCADADHVTLSTCIEASMKLQVFLSELRERSSDLRKRLDGDRPEVGEKLSGQKPPPFGAVDALWDSLAQIQGTARIIEADLTTIASRL